MQRRKAEPAPTNRLRMWKDHKQIQREYHWGTMILPIFETRRKFESMTEDMLESGRSSALDGEQRSRAEQNTFDSHEEFGTIRYL